MSTDLLRLRRGGRELSPKLRAAIVAEGAVHVPALLAMLEDDSLFTPGPTTDGFAPVHAVELLCALAPDEALGRLLDLYFRRAWSLELHGTIVRGLQKFGPRAVEPVLAALDRARDPHDRGALCEVLAKLGVQDERLFEAFRRLLDEDLVYGALTMAEYGDRRAAPLIGARLESLSSSYGPRDVLEIAAAYRALEGQFTPAMESRVAEALAAAEAVRTKPATVQTGPKVGRNDPCPCGSGKKHKKCCGA